MATGFFAGHIAAAVPSIYKDGAGCGACFQVRCTNPSLRSTKGTTVMVTDLNRSNQTDLLLSSRAFRAMAKPVLGADRDLLRQGIVDVQYQRFQTNHLFFFFALVVIVTKIDENRVPCDYGNKKMMNVRVEESSKKPNYLAIKLLYQGGQTEVVAIDIAQVGSSNWSYMTRRHGAVWVTDNVPTGPLQFRFVVTAGYDGKMLWSKKVLPANWEAGKTYDAGAKGYFDTMAVHPYMGPADAAPEKADDGSMWTMMHTDALVTLMNNRGDKGKPIWFTEFGWSVHENSSTTPNWNRGVSESTQADYFRRAVKLTQERWPQVGNMIWYNSRDKRSGDPQQDGYGLIKADFTPRLGLALFAALRVAGPVVDSVGGLPVPTPDPTLPDVTTTDPRPIPTR